MTSTEFEGVKLKRWTRAEFERACEILHQERLELVEGDVIDKMGQNRPHSISLALLHGWLITVFGVRFVHQETPIDVAPEDNSTSEPLPDLFVLQRDFTEFRNANPGPDDLHLVIEVSDTTLGFDFHAKGPLYARAGIVEYWLLDIAGRRMIVHREPQDGQYRSRMAYSEEETLAPLAAPAAFLKVADAFAL